MNYWIRGSKKNSERIAESFKKLGFLDCFKFNDPSCVYFTWGDNLHCTASVPDILEELLKGRSDFQMLRLNPFDAGEWIVQEGVGTYKVVEVCQSWYEVETLTGERRSISFEHEFECHRFGINDVKDGDIVAFNDYDFASNRLDWVGIYHQYDHLDMHKFHCTLNSFGKFGTTNTWHVTNIQPASTDRMMKLFVEMKNAGFKWDVDKKELSPIRRHFDISQFKLGMDVLVRNSDDGKWTYTQFSHYDGLKGFHPFTTSACAGFAQCIPLEGNKHLVGTTEKPDVCYINW